MAETALGGLRVVELGGRVAASYASKQLADLGADVTKLEPPSGDPLRRCGPAPRGPAGEIGSGLFHYLNANKQSVVADLGTPDGVRTASQHIANSDVVIEALGPGRMERYGLLAEGEETERAGALPSVVVRISNFGQKGPWAQRRATDLSIQAEAGLAQRLGQPGERPVHVRGRLAEHTAGTFAAAAALAALAAADRHPARVVADLSILECMLCAQSPQDSLVEFLAGFGVVLPSRARANPGFVRASDTHVAVNTLTGQNWADLCALIDARDYLERMQEVQGNDDARAEYVTRLERWSRQRSAAEVVDVMQCLRIPAARVADGREMLELPHFTARGFFVEQPGAGFLRPSMPYRLGATPVRLDTAAPALGSGPSNAPRAKRTHPTGPNDGRLPLAGIRVLDLTSYLSGGHCTTFLAALGAEVVKVEAPKRPDGYRLVMTAPTMSDRWWEISPLWQAANLGKRSLALDLALPEGKALLEALVAEADVLAENYSPRVIEDFDLDYDRLREINPSLIMLRMPGFGLTGPWRDHVGFAYSFEQIAGMAQNGDEGSPFVQPYGIVDVLNGQHAATALLAALRWRKSSGRGQLIELAQVETVACLTADQVIDFQLSGRCRPRSGNREPGCAPQGVYPCEGEDRWVAITITSDAQWGELRQEMGDPAWAREPAFDSAEDRWRNHDDLDAHLAAWTAGAKADALAERLQSRGVAAATLRTLDEIPIHPQLRARRFHRELTHPVSGLRRYPTLPVSFSFGELHFAPAPTLGQHNAELLARVGVASAEIAELEARGVTGTRLLG